MSKKQKGFQDDEQNTFGQINERFAALFDYAFERLFDIKQLIEVKVFLYLAKDVHFGSGRVHVTPTDKKMIISRLGISDVSLRKSLKSLLDHQVITNVVDVDMKSGEVIPDRYEYMLNPRMVWRGDPSARFFAIKQFDSFLDSKSL